MKTLVIETSTEKSCLALLEDSQKIALLSLPGGPELSKRLAHEVSTLLKKNSFHPEQIAFGEGPGSFTGVRVGTALAKALAYGWGIPLLPFCSLKIFLPEEDGRFAVLIDARMGGIYTLLGEKEKGSIHYYLNPAAELLSPEKVKGLARETPILLSPHPELIEKRISLPCREAILNWKAIFQIANPSQDLLSLENPLDLKPSCPLR